MLVICVCFYARRFLPLLILSKIATAVALSVTTSLPFNGTTDQNLSIAYISAFILVFVVSLAVIYNYNG